MIAPRKRKRNHFAVQVDISILSLFFMISLHLFGSSRWSSPACTLRVRSGRSLPNVNHALYMAHAMYCQVADFRKSLETLSRAARRSAKPAPPGLYLNGPQHFHESERKDAFPRCTDLSTTALKTNPLRLNSCMCIAWKRGLPRGLDEQTGVRCAARKWRN